MTEKTENPTSCLHGCRLRVKTPTFNLRVEIPSRFRKFENQKCLRPLLREDDRENNSAHSWLLHVFTQPGSKTEVAALRRDVRSAPNSGHRRSVRLTASACRIPRRCCSSWSSRLWWRWRW